VNLTPVLLAVTLLGANALQCAPSTLTVVPAGHGERDYVFEKPAGASDDLAQRPKGIAVAPNGDVWVAFPFDNRIGILTADRLVRCSVPGQTAPGSIAATAGTIVVEGDVAVSAIDAATRTVAWSFSDKKIQGHDDLAVLPNGEVVAWSRDLQPGMLGLSRAGPASLLDVTIGFVGTSASAAYALQNAVTKELYNWNGSRFVNDLRFDRALAVVPVKGSAIAIYQNAGETYYQHVAFIDSKGNLRDFGTWPPGGAVVTQSIVAPNGNAYLALRYIQTGSSSFSGNLAVATPKGDFNVYTVGGASDPLDAIAVAPNGTIWIADYDGSRVVELPPNWPAK
jgi:hypothetical protein